MESISTSILNPLPGEPLAPQNGTVSSLSVPLSRLLAQISLANSDLLAGGVARIISTAAGTVISRLWPFMLITAVSHWPRLVAPWSLAGLYWRVRRPRPWRLKTTPRRVLQARQFQIRLSGAVFSSNPSRWPTST